MKGVRGELVYVSDETKTNRDEDRQRERERERESERTGEGIIPAVAKLIRLINVVKVARFITSQPTGNMLTIVRDRCDRAAAAAAAVSDGDDDDDDGKLVTKQSVSQSVGGRRCAATGDDRPRRRTARTHLCRRPPPTKAIADNIIN